MESIVNNLHLNKGYLLWNGHEIWITDAPTIVSMGTRTICEEIIHQADNNVSLIDYLLEEGDEKR